MSEETDQKSVLYAVVDHGGRQFRVEVGDVLTVDHVEGEVGAKVSFGRPLLVQKDAAVSIGSPVVAGAAVEATIMGHARAKKILIFKFKKTKNYRRRRGHRQDITKLRIDSITI